MPTAKSQSSSRSIERSQPAASPSLPSLALGWNLLEYLAVFIAGFLLMQYFFHHHNPPNKPELGVPEHDSWYHMKMAIELPNWGFVGELPWLHYGYLDPSDKTGNHFVSHHVGFHVLLIPFLYISKWITGAYEPGARWAMASFFGAVLVLIDMLLITARVRWRWLWIAAVLLLPHHFFLRAGFVRAISASLALMLLIVLALFRGRPVFAGIATMLYALLYLGSLPFAPIIIGTFALCCWVGPHSERKFHARLILFAFGGLLIGFLLYPYNKWSMIEFLRLQILGTGLGADIEVGTEWRPYNNTRWFLDTAGPLLAIWATCAALRLRFGPNVDAKTATLVLLNFGFLLLTLLARRFIEYWPVFGLLSAAYMAAPVLDQAVSAWKQWRARHEVAGVVIPAITAVLMLAFTGWVIYKMQTAPHDTPWDWIKNEWATVPWIWAAFAIIGLVYTVRAMDESGAGRGHPLHALLASPVLMAFMFSFISATNVRMLLQTRNELKCTYPLKEVREALGFIRENSQPGEIVFTDDWDDFGLYFYHNSHNYYIVGLDPKFTQERRPDLWERFVKITRGQTPAHSTVTMTLPDGSKVREQVHSRLQDIRDHFKAKWVICDRDHNALSRQLADSGGFAKLVYPCDDYSKCGRSRYLVFRIQDGDSPSSTEQAGPVRRIVQLADLRPANFDTLPENCFADDELVGGGLLRIGMETHLRGISTRSGCAVAYEVPEGFDHFQATFGMPERSSPAPSTQIRVLLDGQTALEQALGESGLLKLDVPLNGAKNIQLMAEAMPAANGEEEPVSFVWGSARFVRTR